MKRVFTIIIMLISGTAISQEADSSLQPDLIQFTGAVFNEFDKPIQYVTVININKNLGQISNENGRFSIVVSQGDTIQFTYIGFKLQQLIIPDTVENERFSKYIYLSSDTIYLKGATIRPFPSRQQFRQVFMNLDTKGPEEAIAPHAGFVKREAPPKEPEPTIMNPASLLFRGIENLMKKTRKRKKARNVEEWVPSE
ncbi:MAG: hypothetical protein HKN92_03160 [Chitinophagales bacterium]|nr:hypothetical protein [Chitinophagales bacterium]